MARSGAGPANGAAEAVSFDTGHGVVSGLWLTPPSADAVAVIAHGAGAGMRQPFLGAIAEGLAGRGIASLRYQFPYMEAGKGRPDTPRVAVAAVRAAVTQAKGLAPGLPVFAGGKSFGGRMTSTAEAEAAMEVKGLFFLGFPLHPPGRPGDERAAHLSAVTVPMLFLQGSRDDFAQLPLLRPVCARLGERARLRIFEGADHSFHVLKASGTSDAAVREELLDALAGFITAVA